MTSSENQVPFLSLSNIMKNEKELAEFADIFEAKGSHFIRIDWRAIMLR